MMAKINERFIILGLPQLCRQIAHNCKVCKLYRAKQIVQQMAPLPITRLEPQAKPFENCGMDFAGHFDLKVGRGSKRTKAYILVITCLATRAVHLEPTGGMDTSHVINALSRFCSIRGTPKTMRSDNAPQFHKADKELCDWLASIDWDKVVEKFGQPEEPTNYGIMWYFNPPLAPHFGGIFEIIVKAAKRALKAIVGHAEIYEEEFRTFVYAVMSKLNDRPIGKLATNNDLEPLTPNHFLTGILGYSIFPPQVLTTDIKSRWFYITELTGHFWKRFNEEIVPDLRPRHKWSQEQENVTVGDIVVEIDENSQKHQWRMVKITKVFPSPDGLVRKVEIVRTATGKPYNRAISRLIPIVVS